METFLEPVSGVAFCDTSEGVLSLGQFKDDSFCSALRKLFNVNVIFVPHVLTSQDHANKETRSKRQGAQSARYVKGIKSHYHDETNRTL